jgi:hypothetical protein
MAACLIELFIEKLAEMRQHIAEEARILTVADVVAAILSPALQIGFRYRQDPGGNLTE